MEKLLVNRNLQQSSCSALNPPMEKSRLQIIFFIPSIPIHPWGTRQTHGTLPLCSETEVPPESAPLSRGRVSGKIYT